MDAEVLLSLDMSTTCTGYSVFDLETEKLLYYGKLRPATKGGVNQMKYPKQQLTKMRDLAAQILTLINNFKPKIVVIEEIAGSKNRLGQKTLDGLHWIVMDAIGPNIEIVQYYDVGGAVGWRTHLRLRLSDADKLANKEAKVLNKKLPAAQRLPVIGPKHLACQYVNHKFGTNFDVEACETDSDVCDSIAMGAAFLTFRFAKGKL